MLRANHTKNTLDQTFKTQKNRRNSEKNISVLWKKKLPTIRLIQEAIKDDICVSDSLLRNALLRMGFCCRRTTDDHRVVIEKTGSKAARARYIRAI